MTTGASGRNIYLAGFAERRPTVPTDAHRLETATLHMLRKDAAGYFAGCACLERTMAANRAAFDLHCIVQPVMRDVSTWDLSRSSSLAAPFHCRSCSRGLG